MKAQFTFHRTLFQRIKSEPFFSYDMVCFLHKDTNYIVYVERGPSEKLWHVHTKSGIATLEKVFGEIADIFKKIDFHKGVFVA